MNTFLNILKSINWVDVAMLVLLIRIVFIGIKNGFVTELFKLLGVLTAVFAAFHHYVFLTSWLVRVTHWTPDGIAFVFFVLIISLVVLGFKFLRDGFFMIFKFESTHAGVNQWGAGLFAVIRAVFLASLILYAILLSNVEYLQKQTLTSISKKIALKVGPSTYSFLFNNVVGKIFQKERFNEEVVNVLSQKDHRRK